MSPDVEGEWRKDLHILMATKLGAFPRNILTADHMRGGVGVRGKPVKLFVMTLIKGFARVHKLHNNLHLIVNSINARQRQRVSPCKCGKFRNIIYCISHIVYPNHKP